MNGAPVLGLTPGAANSVNCSISKRRPWWIRTSVAEISNRHVTNVTMPKAPNTSSNTHPMIRVRAADGSTWRHSRRPAATCRASAGPASSAAAAAASVSAVVPASWSAVVVSASRSAVVVPIVAAVMSLPLPPPPPRPPRSSIVVTGMSAGGGAGTPLSSTRGAVGVANIGGTGGADSIGTGRSAAGGAEVGVNRMRGVVR